MVDPKFYVYSGTETKGGTGSVLHVYYDTEGQRHEERVPYKPMLGKRVRPVEGKEYQYRDIYDNPLQWKRFDNIAKYRHFIETYDDVDFYGTMREDYQFLSDVYKEMDYDLSMVRPFFIDIEITMSGDPMEKVMANASEEITSIAMKDVRRNSYYVFSTKPWQATETHLKGTKIDFNRVNFSLCDSEEVLFKAFRMCVRQHKPDMLIGFYASMFDFPYIVNRGNYVMGKEFMNGFSPYGRTTVKKKVDQKSGKVIDWYTDMKGMPLMDYQKMYKKFTYKPRESYSLDFLATEELGETKLDYSEYDGLADLWNTNPQMYIDYNIYDVELMDLMDQKLGLVDLTCTLAYFAKCNYTDTMGTVGIWDTIFFNVLKRDNVMIPPKHGAEKEKYAGAYVYQPKPIIHDWAVAVDLKSLYPHVQQQYNISPESLVDGAVSADIDIKQDLDDRYLNEEIQADPRYIMAPNGQYFRKDKDGIVPGILKEVYSNRVVAKKEMNKWRAELQTFKEENGIDTKTSFNDYKGRTAIKEVWADYEKKISTLNNYQMAMKILMNSEYGALANVHFRYYDIRLASAITLGGQLALKWAAKRVMNDPMQKKYKWELLYGDTDSLYIGVKHLVDQIKMRKPDLTDVQITGQINNFVKKIIDPILIKGYDDLATYVNANECRMFMNHEKTITNALWPTKKRYALNVLWDEGVTYPEPVLKVKGLEIVRSSTPAVIRKALKEAVRLMLSDEHKLVDYVKDQKAKFQDHGLMKIAFPRGVSTLEKYEKIGKDGSIGYGMKTPIGVRAACVYNNAIRNMDGWNPIVSGNKIKFVYLRQPNPYDENVIGFLRRCPDEAIKYIDWDLQFEKSFLSVIQNIYQKMGKEFSLHKEVKLTDIF